MLFVEQQFDFNVTRFHANIKAQFQLVSSSNHSFLAYHHLLRSLPPCSTAPPHSFRFAVLFLLPPASRSFLQLTSLLITLVARPYTLL